MYSTIIYQRGKSMYQTISVPPSSPSCSHFAPVFPFFFYRGKMKIFDASQGENRICLVTNIQKFTRFVPPLTSATCNFPIQKKDLISKIPIK